MPSEGRLHPISVPYRAARSILRLIGPIVVLGIGTRSVAGIALGPRRIAGLVGLVLAGVIGWQIAYYRRFEYRLVADTLEISSGVIARRTREIPRERIQNLDIQEGIVGRAFGVAEVRFETAGGQDTEGRLRYVPRSAADRLQAWVDSGEAGTPPVTEATAGPDRSPGSSLYEIRPSELAILSVTSLDLRSLAFVVAGAFGVLPSGVEPRRAPRSRLTPTGIPRVGAALNAVELSVIAVLGNAALRTARYFRFQLWEDDGTLRYERGLLRRYSGSIPLRRLHLLRLRDNPLSRLAGYAALDIETAGYGPEANSGSEVAVPIAPRGRAEEIAADIEPHQRPGLTRPPTRARRRYAVRYAIVVALFVGALYVLAQAWRPFPWYLGTGLLAAVPVAAHLTWRHRGYAVGDRHLIVRRGFWRRATYVVPYHRVQTVGTTANPFQRRLGLTTLLVDTASGTPAAVDIDADAADRLEERVADELQLDRERRAASVDPFRWVGEPA